MSSMGTQCKNVSSCACMRHTVFPCAITLFSLFDPQQFIMFQDIFNHEWKFKLYPPHITLAGVAKQVIQLTMCNMWHGLLGGLAHSDAKLRLPTSGPRILHFEVNIYIGAKKGTKNKTPCGFDYHWFTAHTQNVWWYWCDFDLYFPSLTLRNLSDSLS